MRADAPVFIPKVIANSAIPTSNNEFQISSFPGTSHRVGGGRDTLHLNRKNGNDLSTTPSRMKTKNRNGNNQQRPKHGDTNDSRSCAKPRIFPNKLSDDVGGGNAPVLSNSNRNYNHKKKQSKNDILRQNDERKKRNKKKRDNKNKKGGRKTSIIRHGKNPMNYNGEKALMSPDRSSCRESLPYPSPPRANSSATQMQTFQNELFPENTFTETRWSSIARIGHAKNEAERLRIEREHEKNLRETEAYAKLETLKPETECRNSDPYINQRKNCASSLEIDFSSNNYTEEREKIVDATCPPNSSFVPAIANVFNRECNVVKILDTEKLRGRWDSLVKQMQKIEIEQIKHNINAESCIRDTLILSETATSDECDVSISDGDVSDDSVSSSDSRLHRCLTMKYPLHYAIINSDSNIVNLIISNISYQDKRMPLSELDKIERLSLGREKLDGVSNVSALQLAILLDKPTFVRLLLKAGVPLDEVDDLGRTPLMLACRYALDECVKLLLAFGAKLSTKNQLTGDGALHIACRWAEVSTVELLLCPSSSKEGGNGRMNGNRSMRQRLVCARNHKGEAPLHVASSMGRADIVEVILSLCTQSCVAKVLGIEDARGYIPLLTAIEEGATDIARHFLEWRCNERDLNLMKSVSSQDNKRSKFTCPLVLAVVTGNLEMVHVLIECGDPSASSFSHMFDYNGALSNALLCFEESSPNALEIISVLIKAGADPYRNRKRLVSEKECDEKYLNTCPLYIASCKGQVNFVTTMIDRFTSEQKARQEQRQLDPSLRHKSMSHLRTIESVETETSKRSLEDALIKSLFLASNDNDLQAITQSTAACVTKCINVSLEIMKRGFPISSSGIDKLLQYMVDSDNKVSEITIQQNYIFDASYTQPIISNMSGDKVFEQGWSMACLHLEWAWQEYGMCDLVCCDSLKKMRENKDDIPCWVKELLRDDECYLIVQGKRLLAHKTILSAKSGKLQAAIRFAEMNKNFEECTGKTEVYLDAEFDRIKNLVLHCYHGSLVSGLAKDYGDCCQQLLELHILGEEYICPSLSLECEMRLLSSNPYICFCKHCSCDSDFLFRSPFPNISPSSNYSIEGPPKLLTSKTILDVFAFVQDIFDSTHAISSNYSITLKRATSQCYTWGPLIALRCITCRILLLNFCEVRKSDSFLSIVDSILKKEQTWNTRNKTDHHVSAFLLQKSVQELREISHLIAKPKDENSIF